MIYTLMELIIGGGNPSFNYAAFCLMMQDPWGDFSDIKVIGNLFDNYDLIKEVLK